MRESVSIWWFAGLLFSIYGVITLATGLWELVHPPENPPVLSQLHAPIWWGAILAAAGFWYLIRFRSRKSAG